MQLILAFNAGDGCTYSCDVRLPFVYDSTEAAAVDLEDKLAAAYAAGKQHYTGYVFEFAGHRLDASDFYFDGICYPPDIWTIDEWFNLEANPNQG